MLTILDFNLSQRVEGIFIQHRINGETEILLALEKYKFLGREDIFKTLGRVLFNHYTFSELTEYSPCTDREMRMLEEKYGVLIVDDGEDVCIFSPVFHVVDTYALELDLSSRKLVYYNITPANYAEFAGIDMGAYDPEILFKRILIDALDHNATDIHFDVQHVEMEPVYTVSYRIGPDLVKSGLFCLNASINASIITNLIEHKTSSTSMDLITVAGVSATADNIFGDGKVELRVTGNRVKDGYHYVTRIQEKNTFNFSLPGLGFAKGVTDDLYEAVRKRSGITLITGAIRTGKNTTAYAMLNALAGEPVKIVSYESPIEVLMPFTQIDYMNDEESLLNAVRLAKKQDINIAFINEIPNKEVAFALRDLANSSIHVITTMHVDRIWHVPYKLKEYFGDSYKDVISQINGVFNQKMFGVPCRECRNAMLVDDYEEGKVRDFLKGRNVYQIQKSAGCPKCDGSGTVPGANKPYAEHVIFTDSLKSELLKCGHPYEMESCIKEYVKAAGHTLEDYMLQGIVSGDLDCEALQYVL